MQHTLLAQTAVRIICSLERQQTRLMADYLQVLLNVAGSASMTDAVLESLNDTVSGMKPPSKMQHAQDNQLLLTCFALQLMLHTLMAPLQQIQDFHRTPGFNVEPSNQQHILRQSQSATYTKLAQYVMLWLQMLNADTQTQRNLVFQRLRRPIENSKLPDVDDAALLDLDQLEVGLDTLTAAQCLVTHQCASKQQHIERQHT